MTIVISVENLSKVYQLGVIGSGTFRGDMQRWWAKMRGQPDPLLKVGEADHGNRVGQMIWALKDINFDIQQGEAIGIIGRNGAGKSTLLKILSRVTAPTSGLVKVKGRIASLLEVGTGFHPELTGRENIFLNGAILGMSRDEVKRKFDQIVDFSGVEGFIDTPVKRYSSGMYVRLAFAVAAHLEPEILVVDEVLAVGDADFQKKCLGKMDDVTKEGRTVLFVSHNMLAVGSLCQTAMVLQNGKLEGIYPVNEAIDVYMVDIANQVSRVNPALRTDRQGNGKALIADVKTLNSKNEPVNQIPLSGSPLAFQVDIEGKEFIKNSARIAIGIYDTFSRCILWLDSQALDFNFSINKGGNRIICQISPDIALAKGTYNVNVAVFQSHDMLDYLQLATNFEIVDGDFYGTGKISGGNPTVYVRQEWKCQK